MNPQIRELFDKSEGRYLSDAEAIQLGVYAEGMLDRLQVMQAIERAEPAILGDVVGAVTGRFPEIAAMHGEGSDARIRRDQALVLRYASFAMVLQDKSFIYDKLAVWLRTIMVALCQPDHVLFGYRALVAACRSHLTTPDAEALVPFLEVMIAELEPYSHGGKPS